MQPRDWESESDRCIEVGKQYYSQIYRRFNKWLNEGGYRAKRNLQWKEIYQY
jgi:hypothetical protein